MHARPVGGDTEPHVCVRIGALLSNNNKCDSNGEPEGLCKLSCSAVLYVPEIVLNAVFYVNLMLYCLWYALPWSLVFGFLHFQAFSCKWPKTESCVSNHNRCVNRAWGRPFFNWKGVWMILRYQDFVASDCGRPFPFISTALAQSKALKCRVSTEHSSTRPVLFLGAFPLQKQWKVAQKGDKFNIKAYLFEDNVITVWILIHTVYLHLTFFPLQTVLGAKCERWLLT